jgi:hypothetical protein
MVVSGKRLWEKLDEVSHDPTVYWGRAIYFVKDGGVYSFSFWTPSEMLAEDYAAELSEALEHAYENPNAYAEQEADRETMRAYTVHNVSYELPKVWKLSSKDGDGDYNNYYSKTDQSIRISISFIDQVNGRQLSDLAPTDAMDLYLDDRTKDENDTVLSTEEKMFAGRQGVMEHSTRDRPHWCTIYITKDGGIYSFGAGTVSGNADELFAELEELVENARFD